MYTSEFLVGFVILVVIVALFIGIIRYVQLIGEPFQNIILACALLYLLLVFIGWVPLPHRFFGKT